MKQTDRLALLDWEKYKDDIARATPVDRNMTAAEREKHREYLEKHPIEWIKFFFPNYVKYEFADFQKKAIRRIIAHDEWFEVLSWSRELAKSTVTMFIVMYLTLTGRKKNVILTSNSKDNAVRLLDPYRANLEANGRIMAYYGNRNCRAHGPRMNSPPKGRSLSAHWVPDNLRVVRETRPYVPTYCWSMTLIRTRIPRTRTSSRSAGTGGKMRCTPRGPFPNLHWSSSAETSLPRTAAW